MVVRSKGEELGRVPLADLQAVIVHGDGATLSLNLATALAESGIPLVLCGPDHMPRSMTLPVSGNYESAARQRDQAEAPLPMRKRIWRDLVKAKIAAQATALQRVGHRDHVGLAKLVATVRAGDPDNVEARAARYYWQRLMGPDFRRDTDGGGLNGPLNYGYAILRSAVARAVVAAGLLPGLGVHHSNRLNPFQLVDDVMEPFRPLVDLRVHRRQGDLTAGLTTDGKMALADLVNAPIEMEEKVSPLNLVLIRVAQSLVQVFKGERRDLLLPAVVAETVQQQLDLDASSI